MVEPTNVAIPKMAAETICENSKVKNTLDQNSLTGTKQDRVMVKGELSNGFKDASSTSKLLNIKFTNDIKRPKLNGTICIGRKRKIKAIENGCIKQFKIKKWINNNNEEINESKCFRVKKITSVKINEPITNHDKISKSGKMNGYKNSFVPHNKIKKNNKTQVLKRTKVHQNKLKIKTKHHDKISESGKINGDENSFISYNTIKKDFKTKYREGNGDENSYNSKNTQNDLLTIHHDKTSESREINSIENTNVSNNTHENKLELVSYINNLVDIVCYFSSIDHTNPQITSTDNSLLSVRNEDRNINDTKGTQNVTKSSDILQMRSSDFDNSNNGIKANLSTFTENDIESSGNTNFNNTSDLLNSPNKSKMANVVQKLVKKITINSFPELVTMLNTKDLTFTEFEKLCSQMIFQQMKMFDKGKKCQNFEEFKDHEKSLNDHYEIQLSHLSVIESELEKNKIKLGNEGLSQLLKNKRSVKQQTNDSPIKISTLRRSKRLQKSSVTQKDDDEYNIINNNNSDDVRLKRTCSINADLPFYSNIKKKNELPTTPSILQNSSVIELDNDDDHKKYKTVELDYSDLPKCTKNTQKKLDVLPDPNIVQYASVIEIDDDDDELISQTINSDSSDIPKRPEIAQKKVGVSLHPNAFQNSSVIEIDDDDGEPISQTINSDSSDIPKRPEIAQKKVGVLLDPNALQNSSVIEIDDDDGEPISQTINSDSSDIPKRPEIAQKKVGVSLNPNAFQNSSVIEIDDDDGEPISQTINSDSSDIPKRPEIAQKKVGVLLDPNAFQNSSVIEIDDDDGEPISQTINSDSSDIPKRPEIAQKKVGVLLDPNAFQNSSVIEIDDDDGEPISQTINSDSSDIPKRPEIAQKKVGVSLNPNAFQNSSVIEIDDDDGEPISQTINSDSSDIPKRPEIAQKKVGVLLDPNAFQNSSVIEIDDDDGEPISQTINSDSSDIPKRPEIAQKKVGVSLNPNAFQNSSVIEIDDDDGEPISQTINSDSSDIPKRPEIAQKKVGVSLNPNTLQNSSVIEIGDDDGEPISQTINSDSSDIPKRTEIAQKKVGLPDVKIFQNVLITAIDDDDERISLNINSDNSDIPEHTKVTQNKVGILPDPSIVQSTSVIEIDDEPISQTDNSCNSDVPKCTKITPKKDSNMVENSSVIEMDDDEPLFQTVNFDSSDKESEKQPPRLLTQEHVNIMSDDNKIIGSDKQFSDSQLCIKDSEKKEDIIHFSKEVIEPPVHITSDDVTATDTKAIVNQSCSKIIKEKSTNETSQPIVPKSMASIVPNLSNLETSFVIRKTYSNQSQKIGLNDTIQKFSHKNLIIKPYFFKTGKFIPTQISNVNSGLKTNTITISTAHQRLSSGNKRPLVLKPSSPSPVSKHPAPLPVILNQNSLPSWKELPPAPNVIIEKTRDLKRDSTALLISWNMCIGNTVAGIKCYQIFFYQEVSSEKPETDIWQQIGEVAALSLPMACFISNLDLDQKYHFVVRAVDVHNRVGPFSSLQSLFLNK